MSAFTDARAAFHAAAANMRRAEGLLLAPPTAVRTQEIKRLLAAIDADLTEARGHLDVAEPEPEPLPHALAAHARDRATRQRLFGDLIA